MAGDSGPDNGKIVIDDMISGIPDDTEIMRDANGSEGSGRIILSTSVTDLEHYSSGLHFETESVLTAAFGYAVSRISGSSHSLFCCSKGGAVFPVAVDCSDRSVTDFVSSSAEFIRSSSLLKRSDIPDVHSDILLSFGHAHDDSGIVFEVAFDDDHITVGHHNSSDYLPSTISRLAGVFDRVLSGIIRCNKLSDIEYTSAEDISEIDGFNDTARPLRFSDLLTAFRNVLSEHPDSVMVRYLDKTLTFTDCDRLSTVRDADVIMVIEGGKLIEVGTPNELMGRDSYYRSLNATA